MFCGVFKFCGVLLSFLNLSGFLNFTEFYGVLCFVKFCSILLNFTLFAMSEIQHLREKVALFAVENLIYKVELLVKFKF